MAANSGRTVPVKALIRVDGIVRESGDVHLVIPRAREHLSRTCRSWSGDRWRTNLDTSGLAEGCHLATATMDGLTAGSFRLDVRGDSPDASGSTKSKAHGKGN